MNNNQTNTNNGTERCGQSFGKFNAQGFSKHGFGRHARGPWGNGGKRPKYNVPVNIADTDTTFEVHIYAVGFTKKNIKISVVEEVLYVSGTREVDETKLPNFSTQEFPIKSFERMIGLSDAVDKNGITAKQEDGVLIVTLQKTKAAQTTTQEIVIA